METIHFRSAKDHIRRSPFQAMAAIFVLTITFFVTTTLTVMLYSSEQLLSYFETRPQVIAFLRDEVDSNEVATLQARLVRDTRVNDVKYVSKEDALNIYKEATSDNPLLSELVSPSIFPASLEFSLAELSFAEEVISEVGKDTVVESVCFTASLGCDVNLGDVVGRIRRVTWYMRIGGGTFAALHVATSFLVLLIIIGMRMASRRDEVKILKLIGATPGFIRTPIVVEALFYAVVGVLIGWFFALVLFLYATPSLVGYFGAIPVLPKNTSDLVALFGVVLFVQLLAGVTLALVGSFLALSRVGKNQ